MGTTLVGVLVDFLNEAFPTGGGVWLASDPRFVEIRPDAISQPQIDRICRATEGVNLYYSASIYTPNGRRREADIVEVPGFGIDVDFGTTGHAIACDFLDADDALAHIRRAAGPFQPHMIVNTGGGLQGYIKFDESVKISTPEDLAKVKRVIQGYQRLVGSDVSGPSQPYRLPGSIKSKKGAPQAHVQVIERGLDRPGYSMAELEAYLDEHEPDCGATESGGTIVVSIDDFPDHVRPAFLDLPVELQDQLLAAEPDRSVATWRVLCRLYRLGVGVTGAVELLSLNPRFRTKWAGRFEDEVLRVYGKLKKREIEDFPDDLLWNGEPR